MKAAACTCHAESHYRCVCCKPACALRAKAMSSVWCTLRGMYLGAWGSRVCGTEMNWWPPSVIRTQSAHHSFMAFLVHTAGPVHPGTSVWGRERRYNYSSLLGSEETYAPCICAEFTWTCISWTCQLFGSEEQISEAQGPSQEGSCVTAMPMVLVLDKRQLWNCKSWASRLGTSVHSARAPLPTWSLSSRGTKVCLQLWFDLRGWKICI